MRLIDADKLIEDIYFNAYACSDDEINEILRKQLETNIYVINEQPTAFDVDKVMEQLKENADVISIPHNFSVNKKVVISLNDAVEIVERGGINE